MGIILVGFGFKVHRGLITGGAGEPLAVVKDFDPFKDGRLRLGACGKLAAMDQLAFERAPEAFHQGVVMAVAATAHARNNARQRQSLPITFRGVLDAAIGMMHQARRRLAMSQGHLQSGQGQRGGQRVPPRPADAAARAAIQNASHI